MQDQRTAPRGQDHARPHRFHQPQGRWRLTSRAFVDLALWMAVLGLAMGLVFPPFCRLFGVPDDVTGRPGFRLSCLAAGLAVGIGNFVLARAVIGSRVRRLARGMTTVRTTLTTSIDSGDYTLCAGSDCHIVVDSADELGAAASAFNALVDAVAQAHQVERAISAAATAVARGGDPGDIAASALETLLPCTGAVGGKVLTTLRIVPGSSPATPRCEAIDGADGSSSRILARLARSRPRTPPSGDARILVTPLRVGGQPVGSLLLDGVDAGRTGVVRTIEVVADALAICLLNADLRARLVRQATVDDLTGLANRRAGLERLVTLYERAVAGGEPVGVLLLDVDHFKVVNDTHGHLVGDEVLRHVARTAAGQLRPGDLLCRYGGEELLAVLPGADAEVVPMVAERLRQAVARSSIAHPSGAIRVTVSIGATGSVHGAAGPDRVEDLIRRADQALYAAKAAGRDTVRLAAGVGASALAAQS